MLYAVIGMLYWPAILACYIGLYIIFFITQIHRVRFSSVNGRASRVKPSKTNFGKKLENDFWKENFGKKILKNKFHVTNVGKKILGKKF